MGCADPTIAGGDLRALLVNELTGPDGIAFKAVGKVILRVA